jgi:hypothetical protein
MKLIAGAGALAFTAFAGEAWALEGPTPYLPGVSIGIPIGALPPPGFYASDDNVIIEGGLRNNSGNNLPGNVSVYLNIPSVLWVPTWQPFGFLGNPTFAMAFVQPYLQQNLDFSGLVGPGVKSISNGFFNTIISPLNLSWNFHPFFFKAGLAVYLPDGYTQNNTIPGTSIRVTSLSAIANNFTTFEPDFALTWLDNGWNLTAHAVLDFNTTNDDTKYSSGDVFYLDLTAGKSIGKWSFGVGANYTQQFTNDTRPAQSVGPVVVLPGVNGNKLQEVLVGPYMGYNFGPVELNAKILFGVHAENTFQSNFYHFGASFPF